MPYYFIYIVFGLGVFLMGLGAYLDEGENTENMKYHYACEKANGVPIISDSIRICLATGMTIRIEEK